MGIRRTATTVAITAAATIAVAALAWGQGGFQKPAWQNLSPEHELLRKSVGEWDIAAEMWMAPGSPPTKFAATAKREMILGGYYLQETFRCSWQGKPFEGRLIMGYDTVAKEYVSIWIDNDSPIPGINRGKVEEKDGKKSMITFGDAPDWMTGKPKKTKTVVTYDGDDEATMTASDVLDDGSERMTMRLAYTRKKG